jgi:hypothetical protein
MCPFDLTPTEYKFGMRTGKDAGPNALAALDRNLDQRCVCEISLFAGAGLGLFAHNMPGANITIYI